MNIGILGSGVVGQTLGSGLVALGHQVMMGTRDPGKPEVQKWVRENGTSARAGSFEEAAKFGEMVFLCTLWTGTENALSLSGKQAFAGKVVVDTTNPLDFSGGVPPRMAIGHSTSAGELIQQWLPSAKVVKAFNTVSAKSMIDGHLGNDRLDMFIAGNDEGAKKSVMEILSIWHWNTHDLGGIEQSRLLEYFAMLWILYGFRTNKWNHAFKLVYK